MAVGIAIGIATAMILVTMFVSRRMKKNREEEFKAAAMLFKEQKLREAIDVSTSHQSGREQMVLVITWKEDKEEKFIFDPSQGVRIGRTREENQICVPLDTVSGKHCIIFSNGDNLYIQDFNSTNGTFIKRGFKTYRVINCMQCQENDKIIVGDVLFRIRTFTVDSAQLY